MERIFRVSLSLGGVQYDVQLRRRTLKDNLAIAAVKSNYLGGVHVDSVDVYFQIIAQFLAHLSVCQEGTHIDFENLLLPSITAEELVTAYDVITTEEGRPFRPSDSNGGSETKLEGTDTTVKE